MKSIFEIARTPLSTEEVVQMGQAAARLLEDPLVGEVFMAVEQELLKTWVAADSTDERESLWAATKGLEEIRRMFRRVKEAGEAAEEILRRT